jgi:hypothetical protein
MLSPDFYLALRHSMGGGAAEPERMEASRAFID